MSVALKVENLSKVYRLGSIGSGTIANDFHRWWVTKIRGGEDPFLKIGETNDRSRKGSGDVVYSLRDINFEIQQGDAVGIIGRNGAGKSTLLKILSRVTSPTTGKVFLKGRVASLLEVGTGFNPELTGRENIYLNGSFLGMRKNEITRNLDEIVDFSGVELYIDTPVKRYSSGMYVRLAFAVAAHLDSEILIVDEVLAVGDAEFQKKCLGKMGEVSKGEGRTILFVSHNMGAVRALCQKGIMLEHGTLKLAADANQVIEAYQSSSKLETCVQNVFNNSNDLPVFIEDVHLLLNGVKAKSGIIDFRDCIGFEMTINVTKVVKNRGIIIHCHDSNERLLQAFDISQMPELFEGRPIGRYSLKVEFPHHFLREGWYSFDFEVGHFGVIQEQWEKHALSIKVDVLSRNPRFEAATSNRPNKIYLEPSWSYTFLSSMNS